MALLSHLHFVSACQNTNKKETDLLQIYLPNFLSTTFSSSSYLSLLLNGRHQSNIGMKEKTQKIVPSEVVADNVHSFISSIVTIFRLKSFAKEISVQNW